MKDQQTPPPASPPLVPGAHRSLRAVESADGPFSGVLVVDGAGVAVRADATTFAGWDGWLFAGAAHVAGPIDVVRRIDGHDVLLPWCTERVRGFVDRRASSGRPLLAGEISTLVVSLLRGLGEVQRLAEKRHAGTWWLTDGGRPLLVLGGGDDAASEVVEVVERLAEHSTDTVSKRALARLHDGMEKVLAQPRIPQQLLDQWEAELLGIAAPRPLEADDTAPGRARDLARALEPQGRPLTQPGTGPLVRAELRSRRRGERGSSRVAHPGRASVAHGDRDGARSARDTRAARWASLRGVGGRDANPHGLRRSAEGRVRRRRRVARRAAHGLARGFATARDLVRTVALLRESGERAPDAMKSVSGRASRPSPRRRTRLLVVGAAAAAAVLAVGLLWPSDEPSASAERLGAASSRPTVTATSTADETGADTGTEPTTEPSVPPTTPQDGSDADADNTPDGAVAGLLASVARCRKNGDQTCAVAVATGSAGVVDALDGVDAATSTPELVDEYGDIAVIGLRTRSDSSETDSGGGTTVVPTPTTERMVVLLRQNDEWLVRDVYDVANQPE